MLICMADLFFCLFFCKLISSNFSLNFQVKYLDSILKMKF